MARTSARGIVAARNNTDATALFTEVRNAFGDFRQNYDARLEEIASRLDGIERTQNRRRLPGGGSDPLGGDGRAVQVRDAIGAFARSGDPAPLNTLRIASDPDGGFLVTPDQLPTLQSILRDRSPIRRLARVQPITSKSLRYVMDDSSPGTAWLGESETPNGTSTPKVREQEIVAFTHHALLPATTELLQDADINVAEWLEQRAGEQLGDHEAEAFVSGNGVGKPRGFLSYDTSPADDDTRPWGTIGYVPTGSASAIQSDSLIDTLYSLRAPYRANATWLMNSNTAATVMKLKDGDGNYLWRESFALGQPPTLLGRPVELAEDMPDVASNAFPIALADWTRFYLVADRQGVQVLRDPFTQKPLVLFFVTARVGGACHDFHAGRLLKVES